MADQPRLSGQADEGTAALRVELERELQNKKQCAYASYECTQLTLDGYKYCAKHILQDKNAPYRQCNFIYASNGKRCHLPAPKTDKKDFGYCSEHALKATLQRNRQNSKNPPPHTPEVLLHNLGHYVKKPRLRTVSSSSHEDADETELKTTKYNDPFSDIDANALYNARCNEVLDYCSESESDVEPSTYASVWHDAQCDSSDNESIDSEQEDVLKHANVYTAEEITLVTRDKLIRLQSLYIEQYRHLQHMLRERRRKYLHALKREKETCCNIYHQVRDNPKEQRLYKKLKAYNKYHRTYGVEAILNKRSHDLRAKITDGVGSKTSSSNLHKCIFSEGGVKCGERVLPMAKHCRKHILEDPNQILFRSCGKIKADVECNTPVEAIFEDSACPLHAEIPPLRSYSQPRKDSESDLDESVEAPLLLPQAILPGVLKPEFDYNLSTEIPKMDKVPTLLFEEDENIKSEAEYAAGTPVEQTESKDADGVSITEPVITSSGMDVDGGNENTLTQIKEYLEKSCTDNEIKQDVDKVDDSGSEINLQIDENEIVSDNENIGKSEESTKMQVETNTENTNINEDKMNSNRDKNVKDEA